MPSGPDVKLETLPDGEGFLMRPVVAGLCKYESLTDGTLDLVDIMTMNDALDVKYINETRLAEAK